MQGGGAPSQEPTNSLVDWHKGIGRYQKGKESKDGLHHGRNYGRYDKGEECEPVMFDPFLQPPPLALAYAAWRFKKGRWDCAIFYGSMSFGRRAEGF